YENERQAEPQHAAMEKSHHPLAAEAGPDEQSRKKEKQRHQKDVLPRAVQIEAEPSMGVDNRNRAPLIGRAVERIRRGGKKLQIRQHRVKRQHQQDHKCPQIVERQARPSHQWDGPGRLLSCRVHPRAPGSCRASPLTRAEPLISELGLAVALARRLQPGLRGVPPRHSLYAAAPSGQAGTARPPPSCKRAPAPSICPCWKWRGRWTATGCQTRSPSPWRL